MNKKMLSSIVIVLITATILVYQFSFQRETIDVEKKEIVVLPSFVQGINSLDELNAVFDELDYYENNWKNQNRAIPRITFEKIGANWANNSDQLPVSSKKTIFFRLITPLVLIANENILSERKIVEMEALNSKELIDLAIKYRLNISSDNEQANKSLTEEQRELLLERVDILPPSLAVAQAAEESGWGTSRFAREGNALFGQWDFTGNGMKPEQHRAELGNYGVAKFDSPLASVEAYMLNLNTNNAYITLRTTRSYLRTNSQPVTGMELSKTLDKYSERGQAYIDGLQKMIQFNKLQVLDKMILSDKKLIHLNNRGS